MKQLLGLGFFGLGAIVVVALVSSQPSCSITHKSDGFACPDGTCPTGRMCVDGFCVTSGDPPADAKQPIDSPNKHPDAPDDVCPAACTSCDIGAHTCEIDCSFSDCTKAVACPAGFSCNIACDADGSCSKGVDCTEGLGCQISCTGNGTCHNVTCGTVPCDIQCVGDNSCRTIGCSKSCACDVECTPNSSCEGIFCPSFACGRAGGGCDSANTGCDTCPM